MKNSKKVKTPKKKGKRRLLLFLFVLVIAGILIYMAIGRNGKNDKVESKKKVVDTIDNFNYTISDTDTKLMKDEFKNLKKILSKKEIDYEEYAKEVAKLFVIDFFTLDNKITKNDVGGVQFVYSTYRTTFIDKARDQFYKYVKSNLNDDRNQSLPIVDTINVDSVEQVASSSVMGVDAGDGYKVNLSWTYETDLGYQTSASLIIVSDNDKLSVAKMTN